MSTVYYTATTLDGFLADDKDSLDWLFVQDVDADGPLGHTAFLAGVGALAMGSTTYLWVRDRLAAEGEPWPYAAPTWVFSSRELPGIEGADLRFVQGDVAPVHAAMAAAADGRDVWVVGGGDLAGQFADAGLLDEIVTAIAPVTLGAGRPLFPRRYALRMTELVRNGDFACARYTVVGPRTTDWTAK